MRNARKDLRINVASSSVCERDSMHKQADLRVEPFDSSAARMSAWLRMS